MKKVLYNGYGGKMEKNKKYEFHRGNMILLYGGKHQDMEKMLETLFQCNSNDWSHDYVSLIRALKSLNQWEKRMNQLSFLTLSMFIKIYHIYQKNVDLKQVETVLEQLKLDGHKKLSHFCKEEKERILFLLLFILDMNVYVFVNPFSYQDYENTNRMIKLLEEKKKKGKTIFFMTMGNYEIFEQLMDEVMVIGKQKIIKYEPVSKLCHYDYSIVHLKGKEYKKLRLSIKNLILKEQTEDEIVFLYCGKFQELFSVLQDVDLTDVTIHKQTLEEALYAMKV